MLIRFTKSIATAAQSYRRGRTVEVPARLAHQFVRAGVAQIVDPLEPVAPPAPPINQEQTEPERATPPAPAPAPQSEPSRRHRKPADAPVDTSPTK